MKKTLLIGIPCLVVYLILLVVFAYVAHLTGVRFGIFVGVMSLVGIAAFIAIVLYQRKLDREAGPADAETAETRSLDALVRAAEQKLKASAAGKSLGSLPLVYVVGDSNSAKTHTIVQSGLDPELLAGEVYRDGQVAPTPLANLWYTGHGIVVDAGGALLDQPSLWTRLVRRTQPNKYGAALTREGLLPSRAVLLCVSIEHLMPGQSPDAPRILGQKLRENDRRVSQTLGISLPVYVLFTKLDTNQPFAEYAANLTEEEVRQPLGAALARVDVDAGLYGERAASDITTRFDELAYSLGEFRLEVLGRGGAPEQVAKGYEFPRELRKLRGPIIDFLVEVGRPSQLGVNPFLRGFYFCGVRARIVEESSSIAAAAPAAAPAPADGATRVFSFSSAQIPAAAAVPSRTTRKVPQWAFLPHLLPRLILSDRSALDSSRASTKVNVVKRVLIASLAACVFVYFLMLCISAKILVTREGQKRTGRFEVGTSALDVANYWFLHALCTALPALQNQLHARDGHPEDLYLAMTSLAASLCTFAIESTPASLPAYNHLQLNTVFDAIESHIYRHLEVVVPSNTITLNFTQTEPAIFAAPVLDERCLRRSRWILGIRSSLPESTLLRQVPSSLKICSAEGVVKLVQRALPGLGLTSLQVPPSAMSAQADMHYFSIDTAGPCWQHILATRQVGVYLPSELGTAVFEVTVITEA